MNTNLALYNKQLFEVFSAFIMFCEEHKLNYYCCCGTAIGAVRHQGIIPWDDDIDVFMPRKDFETLLHMKDIAEQKGYSVASIKNGDNYNLFMKFYDKNTALWEIREVPFILGLYIDVFPLDNTNDSKKEFLKKYKRRRRIELLYQLSYSQYTLRGVLGYYMAGNKKYFVKGLTSFFVPSILGKYLRNVLLKIDSGYMNDSGKNLISSYGDYWDKEYLESSWFESAKKVRFEDFEVSIGVGTHEYLTQIYGDYMKLPPTEKQVSHHYHYYLNLDKAMTREEIEIELQK